jgi:hypothetical protein
VTSRIRDEYQINSKTEKDGIFGISKLEKRSSPDQTKEDRKRVENDQRDSQSFLS